MALAAALQSSLVPALWTSSEVRNSSCPCQLQCPLGEGVQYGLTETLVGVSRWRRKSSLLGFSQSVFGGSECFAVRQCLQKLEKRKRENRRQIRCLSDEQESLAARDCESPPIGLQLKDWKLLESVPQVDTPSGSQLTPMRRGFGLLAATLVLTATGAQAEEIESSTVEPTTPFEQNGSSTSNSKDGSLEGEDIKVSGGTSKTEKSDLGPDYRRYRAEDFSLYVPRSYVNVTDEDVSPDVSLFGVPLQDNPRSTLTMEQKVANRKFAARFTSPEQTESITVVIRDASTLRLSFLQTKDITDLGPLDKAAQLLLPPGAKVLKSRVVSQEVDRGQELEKVVKSLPVDIDTKLVRKYYQYEFYARGQQVALTAAAQSGKVYVVGATVPTKKWKDLAKQMRAVTNSFELR